METIKNLDSYNTLMEFKIIPDKYPADAIISGLIGTYSEDRQTVCILINDNFTALEQENINNLLINRDQLKEIALTVKTLITNMGIEVHSHTLKNDPTLNKLKIKKISTVW